MDGLDLREKKKNPEWYLLSFWHEYCHSLRREGRVRTAEFGGRREEEGWGRGKNSYISVIWLILCLRFQLDFQVDIELRKILG